MLGNRNRKVALKTTRSAAGFSLVELMVAMLVGLIIISGAFSLHVSSRKTQAVNEAQMDMVADARIAIDIITYDLRHAGIWGGTNKAELINCKSSDALCVASSGGETPAPLTITNDCTAGWYSNLLVPVFATDNSAGNPYASTCIPSSEGYLAGTDILEVRYADSNATPQVGLRASQAYIRSNFVNGRIFVGENQPIIDSYDTSALTQNHELHAFAYYISSFTDTSGDGIPSLRRASLVNSPTVENQTLLSGVVDLQVQFGVDIDGKVDADGNLTVDRYVDPNLVSDWTAVYSAKIWLIMRSDREQVAGVNKVKTFSVARVDKQPGVNDNFRYFMVSSVVDLRNLKQL